MPGKKATSSTALIGAFAILAGIWPLLIVFDIVQVTQESIRAPRWVLAAAGGVFLLGGCMALLQAHKRLLDLLAGVLLSVFCALGIWATFFAPAESMSGGVFFLSHETNVKLGRVLFGLGALLSLACAVYAFRLALKGRSRL